MPVSSTRPCVFFGFILLSLVFLWADTPPETPHTPWFVPQAMALGKLAYYGNDSRLPIELSQRLGSPVRQLAELDCSNMDSGTLIVEGLDFAQQPAAMATMIETTHRRGIHLVFCNCRHLPPFTTDNIPFPLPPTLFLLPGLTPERAASLEQDYRLAITPHGRIAVCTAPCPTMEADVLPDAPFADSHYLPLLKVLLWAIRPQRPALFSAFLPGQTEIEADTPRNALLTLTFLGPDFQPDGQLRMQLRLKKGLNLIDFPLPPLPDGDHQLVARLSNSTGAVLDCALASMIAEPIPSPLDLIIPDTDTVLPAGTPLHWTCLINTPDVAVSLTLKIHDGRGNLWYEQRVDTHSESSTFSWTPPDPGAAIYRLTVRLQTATGRELARRTHDFQRMLPEPDISGVLPYTPGVPLFLQKRYGGDRLHLPAAIANSRSAAWQREAARLHIIALTTPLTDLPFSSLRLWQELFADERHLNFGSTTPFLPDYTPTPDLLQFAATLQTIQSGFGTLMQLFPIAPTGSDNLVFPAIATLQVTTRKAGENRLFSIVAPEATGPVTLRFPTQGHLYELISGTYLGWQENCQYDFPAEAVRIFSLLPEAVEQIDILAPSEAMPGDTVTITAHGGKGPHVFNLQLLSPDDATPIIFNRNLRAADGAAACALRLPLNAPPGSWTIAVRDLNSGITGYTVILVLAHGP